MTQNFNILYVEDEIDLQNILLHTLELLFNNIYTAQNGEDGLKLFQENKDHIDLIITDINMPKMDGIEMSEQIKNISPEIPIIITTAYNDNNFLHKAIKLGIDGYLLKPLNLKELQKTISKVLETKILQKKLHLQKKEHLERLLASAKFSAIGQLTAGLTHEINTPLTYIKGSLEMMSYQIEDLPQSPIKTEIFENYTNITNGINRIINIVESMKEIGSNSSEVFETVNIYETVVIASIMAYNKAKYISEISINNNLFTIDMEKDTEVYTAKVQKQRIEQVWIIIINNALDELVKISEYSDRKLNITIKEENQSIVIRFSDNAGGIKEEIFEKIFEPFKSTKNSSGMGIGLSLAKKIIEEQNGTIDAYNHNGGAVFEIKLPKFEN